MGGEIEVIKKNNHIKSTLPLLNQEAQEFGIPFKAIEDLTDDNLLILSAFSF